MDDSQAVSLDGIRALVAANRVVRFAGQRRAEVYAWVESTLVRHEYAVLRKPDKGVLGNPHTQFEAFPRLPPVGLGTENALQKGDSASDWPP